MKVQNLIRRNFVSHTWTQWNWPTEWERVRFFEKKSCRCS